MKIEHLILVEPTRWHDYYPFSVMHPVWEIRVGILRLFEKFEKTFNPANTIFYGRKEHLDSFIARENVKMEKIVEGNILLLNSVIVANSHLKKQISEAIEKNPGETLVFKRGDRKIGLYSPQQMLLPLEWELIQPNGLPFDGKEIEIEADKIEYLHDAIFANGKNILSDLELLGLDNIDANTEYTGAHLLGKDNIFIGDNCNIMPGTVIDATEGPVIIANNVKVFPQATIIGPCYIGDNCLIKIGAKIYEDTSIGKFCKVGGEVENTIFHSYSNKQHDGFLGHSYIGEWVNLGADTNNSDLKNTYSNISLLIEDEEIDTGGMFMGLLCGDHTKSAINTSFTTGTVAGISGVLVYEGFHPRFIPSFSWGGKKNSPIFRPAKAIDIARKVMKRRNKELLPEEEILMKMEYDRIKNK